MEKILYITADSLGDEADQTEGDTCFSAVVVPYLDQNRVKLHTVLPEEQGALETIDSEKENAAQRSEHFNTFILNPRGDIFTQINEKFYVFHKSGRLLCEMKSNYKVPLQIKAVSPNGKYVSLMKFKGGRFTRADVVTIQKMKPTSENPVQFYFKKFQPFSLVDIGNSLARIVHDYQFVDNNGHFHYFVVGFEYDKHLILGGRVSKLKTNKPLVHYFLDGEDANEKFMSKFVLLRDIRYDEDTDRIFPIVQNNFLFLVVDRQIEYMYLGREKGPKQEASPRWTCTYQINLNLDPQWQVR